MVSDGDRLDVVHVLDAGDEQTRTSHFGRTANGIVDRFESGDPAHLHLHPAARREDIGEHGAAKNDEQAEEPDARWVEPPHRAAQGPGPPVPSINSTLARGMITPSPDSNVTSSTRAFDLTRSVSRLWRKRRHPPDEPEIRIADDPHRRADLQAPHFRRRDFAAALRPRLRGMTISGRMTPARICVAAVHRRIVALPRGEQRRTSARAMAISPNPSVMMTVRPMRSEPVIATPRL